MGLQGPAQPPLSSKDQQRQMNPMLLEEGDITATQGIQIYSAKTTSVNNCSEVEPTPKDQPRTRHHTNNTQD
jgi:hypothetical protein